MRVRDLTTLALALAALVPTAAGAATYEVTGTADVGGATCAASCTLRQAIETANQDAAADTIRVPEGRYQLSLGELAVSRDLTIVGAGREATVVDAGHFSRVFDVTAASAEVTFSQLAIENGEVAAATADGAGIFSAGRLSLEDVLVRGNVARTGPPAGGTGAVGAGIYSTGDLRAVGSRVEGNEAITPAVKEGPSPAGAGIAVLQARLELVDTALVGNRASGGGNPSAGALLVAGNFAAPTLVRLTRVDVHGNEAVTTAPESVANGGALGLSDTDTTIAASAVVGNRASADLEVDGGGINASPGRGEFILEGSLVAENRAEGAHYANGGGLYLRSGGESPRERIVNSTVADNRLTATTRAFGSGIYHAGSGLELLAATVSGNVLAAPQGGGGNLAEEGAAGSTIAVRDTIVAAGQGPAGADNCDGAGIVSAGHNIDSGDRCGFAAGGDQVDTDPRLGPLAANGGPTRTEALDPGSPAIDAGSDCPATDQRGVARPSGLACDIGAFEFVPPSVVVMPPPEGSAAGSVASHEARLRLRARRVKVNLRTGVGTLPAGCDNAGGDVCRVSLSLFAKRRAAGHGKAGARRQLVGTVRGEVPGAAAGKLRLKLNRRGLTLLRASKRHRAALAVSGGSSAAGGATVAVAAKLTVVGKKPKPGRRHGGGKRGRS